MQNLPTEFSLSGYRTLVTCFRNLGYAVRPFTDGNFRSNARHLLLRHDVDICLARAAILARFEAGLGLSSLYCVLVSSELYNPFSRENISRIRELATLGHEVGLHFDASIYGDPEHPLETEQLTEHVAAEARRLSDIARAPVRVMSFHRPAQRFLGLAERIAGLIHTYEPRLFSEIGYVADSGGKWRYGHPLGHRKIREGGALQLLTHPVWWAHDTPTGSPLATLDGVASDVSEAYRLALAQTCRAFRTRVSGRVLAGSS